MIIKTNALKAVALAVNEKDIQQRLQGVRLGNYNGYTTLVGTDGHRLHAVRLGAAEDFNCIIPMGLVNQALKSKAKEVTVTQEGDTVRISIGGLLITDKSIPGTYPDWQWIIPTNGDEELASYNPSYLVDLYKAAKLVIGGHPYIRQLGRERPGIVAKGVFLGLVMPLKSDVSEMPDGWGK